MHWERYMLCDGNPDPLNTCDLNTFMNLWRDDKEYKPLPIVLDEGEGTLKVIQYCNILLENWRVFLSNSGEEGFTEDELQRLKQSVLKLQELISYKLDEATMNLLQNASDDVDPDTQNLQFTRASENVTVCVWGNIARIQE
ncbi:Protein casc1 [Desmophyllum pertusum]|uniref:Protein casc1 n=1 Tax=Desmophyllum pertusum TaxID=174260 RepID=A0A9X0CU49_9CNID|nr:Protein casc1 [Desmophyllum pertusum]